jgi:hypothetical protein
VAAVDSRTLTYSLGAIFIVVSFQEAMDES